VPDLACANAAGGTVAIFGQTSPRTFSDSPRILDQITEPSSIAAGDLDGDGDIDLAVADRAASNLALFLQTGAGSFDVPRVVGGPGLTSSPVHLVAADVDLDGRLDLATANTDRSIAVLRQDGSGLFDSNPLVLRDETLVEYPRALAFGDIEGDGDLDLAAACDASGLKLFLSTPTRPFAEPLNLHPGPHSRPSCVVIADQDGDGILDLVTGNLGSDNLTRFSQRPGDFDFVSIPFQGTQLFDSALGDLDEDGDLDLASFGTTGSPPEASITFHHQISPRTFERAQDVLLAGAGIGPTVTPVDLDGDGDLDLLTHELRKVQAFLQERGGVFDPDPLTITATMRREPTDPAGGIGTATPEEDRRDQLFFVRTAEPTDLDRDGDLDVAVSTTFGLDLYLQDDRVPAEFFRVSVDPVFPQLSPTQLVAADVDGDGNVDLVARDFSAPYVLFQSGPGRYDPHRLHLATASSEVRAVDIGDHDGDGDADIATIGRRSGFNGTVEAFSQRQPRMFEWNLVTELASADSTFVSVDLDRDGDLDILAGGNVLLQRSPGQFGFSSTFGSSGVSVRTGDIDGDGSCDILRASGFTNFFRLDFFWSRR